ncbi:MAG: DUF362 domain-containing protein [Candidatus Faecousia sp.]|nr:DUF362 domain-containing protein [Candidatus Faecousia sp.]
MPEPYDISIVPCEDYQPDTCRRAMAQVLEPLGGLAWVRPGMKVAIKANLVAPMAPDRAATTHPALLLALSELLVEKGATVVIGDSPGGLYTGAFVEKIYKLTGLEALERPGISLNRDFSQAQASFPEAVAAKHFQYTRYLDDADAVIDFCKLKSHGMMGMSAGAKNLFGVIPGTLKPEYHFRFPDPRDFARMLVDLNAYFKPVLTLVDAVVAMEGNGPTQGTPRPMGALLAARSPHKLDLACAWLIGLERARVPTLEAALERGLIPERVEELRVAGDLAPFRVTDFQKLEAPSSLLFRGKNRTAWERLRGAAVQKLLSARPQPDGEACIGCGKCAGLCPAKAIAMEEKRPRIDRSKCIRCFCCQEFCPVGAMKVHRTKIAKMLNK